MPNDEYLELVLVMADKAEVLANRLINEITGYYKVSTFNVIT